MPVDPQEPGAAFIRKLQPELVLLWLYLLCLLLAEGGLCCQVHCIVWLMKRVTLLLGCLTVLMISAALSQCLTVQEVTHVRGRLLQWKLLFIAGPFAWLALHLVVVLSVCPLCILPEALLLLRTCGPVLCSWFCWASCLSGSCTFFGTVLWSPKLATGDKLDYNPVVLYITVESFVANSVRGAPDLGTQQ